MTYKPTQQYDDRPGDASRDRSGAGAFSMYALERMLRDCQEQPNWRARAAICAAYYDGKQLTEQQRAHLNKEGLDERAINLIRPIVNSVLGQEAKSRTDVRVEADADEDADVAEVVSARLKEAERETYAHMAVSDAYASSVKKGLGWGYVSRNSDPLAYKYRVESVPINEIWWDWRGQRGTTLLDGCRWLVRSRFIDLDELQAAMPEHAELLRHSVEGWDRFLDGSGNLLGEPETAFLTDGFETERRFNLVVPKHDWMDTARKMVKMYEVWYRVPSQCVVLHMGPTKMVPYNDQDPRHVEAVARGLVKVSKGITSQVRMALYAGPYRLIDKATKKRNFPYVPFFAFRDDEDSSPYGLVEGMIAPQDDYNERRHRIQWMLKAKQVHMDSDALDTNHNTIMDIAGAIMRPDLQVITNPNRTNRNAPAVVVKNDLSMQREQFEVMADSKEMIQHAAGRFNSQMGSAQVQSGIANSILVEQGEQAMGEMNDNYLYARRRLFEELVSNIVEDLSAGQMEVPVGTGRNRRVVVLNSFNPETGQPVNQVSDAEIKTSLAETPNTPAYRQQTQQQVSTIINALGQNPQAAAILVPTYIESTSLPNRQEVADALRKASGVPVPGDKNAQAAADAQQAQQLAERVQAEKDSVAAKTRSENARADQSLASARLANANAELTEQRIDAGVATAEVNQMTDQSANLSQSIDEALAEVA